MLLLKLLQSPSDITGRVDHVPMVTDLSSEQQSHVGLVVYNQDAVVFGVKLRSTHILDIISIVLDHFKGCDRNMHCEFTSAAFDGTVNDFTAVALQDAVNDRQP